MKAVLILLGSTLSSLVFANLTDRYTDLSPENFGEAGLRIEIRADKGLAPSGDEMARLTVSSSDPSKCQVNRVYITVADRVGYVLFGSEVARRFDEHQFQIQSSYLPYVTIGVDCGSPMAESKNNYYLIAVFELI